MGRLTTKIFTKVILLIFLLTALLVAISLLNNEGNDNRLKSNFFFTKKVEKYRPLVEKYAIEHNVEEHVDTLLAIMMQESKGRGNDPMQSSESLCGEIGCIDDPEKSIEQGVTYFAKALNAAEGEVELAVQAYNFGLGFINYANEKDEKFSQEMAIQFSQEMYKNAEDPTIYSCLRKGSKELNACYGDIYYVRDVMGYKQAFVVK